MGGRSRTTLAMLIEAGLLDEGERLYASLAEGRNRPTKHFEGEMLAGGAIRIVADGGDGSRDGHVFDSHNAAITVLFGRPESGWKNWKVQRRRRQVTLEVIRDDYDFNLERPVLEPLDKASVDVAGAETRIDAAIFLDYPC